jgi:hypothetical protein
LRVETSKTKTFQKEILWLDTSSTYWTLLPAA